MQYRFGPIVDESGVTFRLYAPSAGSAELLLRDREPIAMQKGEEGFWTATVEGAGEGTRYRFRVGALEFPDLASRQQDGDTKGWSVVRRPFTPTGQREPISPWQEAVCSSLTELFAPKIHKERLSTWPDHYPWIETTGLQYFRNRLTQARRDVEQGLAVTLDYFDTRSAQMRALDILQFKLDVLWAMNDAMAQHYGVSA